MKKLENWLQAKRQALQTRPKPTAKQALKQQLGLIGLFLLGLILLAISLSLGLAILKNRDSNLLVNLGVLAIFAGGLACVDVGAALYWVHRR